MRLLLERPIRLFVDLDRSEVTWSLRYRGKTHAWTSQMLDDAPIEDRVADTIRQALETMLGTIKVVERARKKA